MQDDHQTGDAREAELYARAIVAWHISIGKELARGRMVDHHGTAGTASFLKYQDTVLRFAKSDLTSVEIQAELASTQLAGIFEWFYHEEIPGHIWQELTDQPAPKLPRHLDEAARGIRQLHERMREAEPPIEVDPGRGATVHFVSRAQLRALARQHYEVYTREEDAGIGGANFLLSSSLERSPDRAAESGALTLLNADYLGFHIIEDLPEDHLLRRLRAGEIRIDKLEGF